MNEKRIRPHNIYYGCIDDKNDKIKKTLSFYTFYTQHYTIGYSIRLHNEIGHSSRLSLLKMLVGTSKVKMEELTPFKCKFK